MGSASGPERSRDIRSAISVTGPADRHVTLLRVCYLLRTEPEPSTRTLAARTTDPGSGSGHEFGEATHVGYDAGRPDLTGSAAADRPADRPANGCMAHPSGGIPVRAGSRRGDSRRTRLLGATGARSARRA